MSLRIFSLRFALSTNLPPFAVLSQVLSLLKTFYRSFIDQESVVTDQVDQQSSEDKVARRVTFNEGGENKEEGKPETIRNFYMMDSSQGEGKPNFMMGGEDGFEEKDEFPPAVVNGGLSKQLSDASLIDKRRRLR